MTGTNHALTGAIVALVIHRPELAIPLALISHFLIDLIPHYNPPNVTKYNYKSQSDSWRRKMKDKYFKLIVGSDLVLLATSLVAVPLVSADIVSPWLTLACMMFAILPDLSGGFQFIASVFLNKNLKSSKYDNFHVWLQWKEWPQGVYVEMAYTLLAVALIAKLVS